MPLLTHLFLFFFSLQLLHWQHLIVKCVKFSCGINFSYNKGPILAQRTSQLFYQLLVFALTWFLQYSQCGPWCWKRTYCPKRTDWTLPTVNSYLITSNKDLYYWYCHTLGKKGRGKGLRGRSKALPRGIIVCSLPFRHEVLLDFEGGINVFSSYLEMAAKALVSFCLVPRNAPVSLGKRYLVISFLQHPPAHPPLRLLQCSASQSPLQPPGRWTHGGSDGRNPVEYPSLCSCHPAQGRKPLCQPHFGVLTAPAQQSIFGGEDATHLGGDPPLRVSYPHFPLLFLAIPAL